MTKTKEQIQEYNKEYFARPEVVSRAKIRNAKYRQRRSLYKKTPQGKEAEKRYRSKPETRSLMAWGRIKNRYGLTENDYNLLLENQRGACAICLLVPKTVFHIDHSHKTGKVRGLLCVNCNMAIGLLKDNIDFLAKAIAYLQ